MHCTFSVLYYNYNVHFSRFLSTLAILLFLLVDQGFHATLWCKYTTIIQMGSQVSYFAESKTVKFKCKNMIAQECFYIIKYFAFRIAHMWCIQLSCFNVLPNLRYPWQFWTGIHLHSHQERTQCWYNPIRTHCVKQSDYPSKCSKLLYLWRVPQWLHTTGAVIFNKTSVVNMHTNKILYAQHFPAGGINIFGNFLHTHTIGKYTYNAP